MSGGVALVPVWSYWKESTEVLEVTIGTLKI